MNNKPKVDRTKFMIQDKKNEIVIKKTGDVDGSNFKIRKVDNCTIYLLDWTNGMFIDDCTNCKIIVGPCDGALFIRTSQNCEISAVCKQLRFRDCRNIRIFTYCPSDPVVENSSLVHFAPYNASFPRLKELFVKGKFSENENKYQSVYDFSEKRNINDEVHWDLMKEEDFVLFDVKAEDIGEDLSVMPEPLYDAYRDEIEFMTSSVKFTSDVLPDFNNVNNVENNEFVAFTPLPDLNNVNIVDNNEFVAFTPLPDLNNLDNNEFVPFSPLPDDIIVVDNNLNNENISNFNPNNNAIITDSPPNDYLIVNSFNVQQANTSNDNYVVINDFSFPNTITNTTTTNNAHNVNNTNTNTFNANANFTNAIYTNEQFDNNFELDEETQALRLRQIELEERQKKIIMKMEEELRVKSQLRTKAREYLDNFNTERMKIRERNRNNNKLDEENYLIEKKNMNIKNPWNKVVGLIEVKESNYQGSKNVDRMREVIIRRKADFETKSIN